MVVSSVKSKLVARAPGTGTTRGERCFAGFVGVCTIGVTLAAFAQTRLESDSASSPASTVAAARQAATSRGLALRGTIVMSDARLSEALVDFGGGDLHRVRTGAALGHYGMLIGIQTQSILIRRNGAVFEFSFNDSAYGGSGTLVAASADSDTATGSADPDAPNTDSGFVWAEVDTGPPKQMDEWHYDDE